MCFEESISSPKSYVLSFNFYHKQLQSPYPSGLLRESHSPHTRLNTQSKGRCSQRISTSPPLTLAGCACVHNCIPSPKASIWRPAYKVPYKDLQRSFLGTSVMTTLLEDLETFFSTLT